MTPGYAGKILRVDLSRQHVSEEKLPDNGVLKAFIGGFGLGLKILYDECLPGMSPTDPENPLIFMTGPLTGMSVPSPCNTTAVSLNFATEYTAGRSHSHGRFGPLLKFAGYDGIVIKGASERPVYLWIHDGQTEFKDAKKFWGRDTHHTEDLVKEDLKNRDATVAAIGPGGENLCHEAIIENDKHHSFSHSGFGGVMGSKKLKAIAVYGAGKVAPHDPAALEYAAKEWTKSLLNSEMGKFWIASGRSTKGRKDTWDYDETHGLISSRNFQVVSPAQWLDDIHDVANITPEPCYMCPLGCSHVLQIVKGPHKGQIATPSGGGENMEGPASSVGVYDTASVYRLVELQDRLGFEAGYIGSVLGFAFECYEKRLITKEDTGGVELRWGDVDAAAKLMEMIAKREKIGNILAMGVKRASQAINKGSEKFIVHIKGAAPSWHDWRSSWGIMFGQIVGGGSGWPAPGVTSFTIEPDVGYAEFQDPLTPDGKAEAARRTGMKKYWDDAIGTCWNATWGIPGSLKYTAKAVAAVTGWEMPDALLVGERIMNLERLFNVRHGLTPVHDLDIGPRFLEPPKMGPAKGKTIAPYLPGMLSEYYRLMGWDENTGKPWRGTLKRLGLEEYSADIWR